MNLHQMVRNIIPVVNPDISVKLSLSTGYTTSPSGVRVPSYSEVAGVNCQMQPLSNKEIAHMDGLNIQGELRGFRMNGKIQGLSRPLQKGGDMITLGDGSKWLVVHVFEDWSYTAGWSYVAGARQNG